MHKVLIVSDSHGLTEQLNVIKERHQVDYMLHCGDSELDMDDPAMADFLKVRGNCDFDVRYPLEQTFSADGIVFFMAHGHLLDVKMDLTKISYRGEELKANVICFGHTHVAGVQKMGDQVLINPGSIRLPKGRLEKTYALLQWENIEDGAEVAFYTVDGERLDELSEHVSFK